MFTTNYQEFIMYQKELHQQAAQYRLVNSFKKTNPWISTLLTSVGRVLILTGQQIINRYQTA